VIDININEYDYNLPEERIAQYPLKNRDRSKLLIDDGKTISSGIFSDIDKYICQGTMMVFNNTRVIRARLLFRKGSGAVIEVLCLEPLAPADYETSFASTGPADWKCMIGNLKKWKSGPICNNFEMKGRRQRLCAERISPQGDAWRVRFSWDNQELSFGEVIGAAGHVPLPPYIKREDDPDDIDRYQTVYSSIKGSVAAPTAGLHFTNETLKKLSDGGVRIAEITLHVGAGTFQPVRVNNVFQHNMHSEHYYVTRDLVEDLIKYHGHITAVGTTSVRTLESLYWLGVKLSDQPSALRKSSQHFFRNFSQSINAPVATGQWEPYSTNTDMPVKDSLSSILELMDKNNLTVMEASTMLMICPGYRFRVTDGIVTNFHQPKSTLLLLVSAWSGPRWHDIYRYALENDFRFLSYGDSSLLLR